MNILVTGATGFVGQHVVATLNNNHNVIETAKKDLDLSCEEKVKNFLKSNNFDWIIHCATGGQSAPDNDFKMATNLIQNSKSKFLIFGSGVEFNFNFNDKYNRYAEMKRKIYQLCNTYNNCHYIRIFGCFGPYESINSFPTVCVLNSLNNKNIIIKQDKLFDFIHIKDVCRLVKLYIEQQITNKCIDACYSNEKYSLYDIANYIQKQINNKNSIYIENKEIGASYVGYGLNSNILEKLGDHFSLFSRLNLLQQQIGNY